MTHSNDQDTAPAFSRLESLTAVIVVGVLALALGLVGLSRPTHKVATKSVGYTQTGRFGYSAKADPGSLYGPGGVKSGDPILTKRVGPVTVRFRYLFTSQAPAMLHGTARMVALVQLSQGLSRSFPMATGKSFARKQVTLSGALPLQVIKHYVSQAQSSFADTGLSSATVVVKPVVAVRGSLGTHPVKTRYAPKLSFSLNGDQLTLGQGSDAATPLTGKAANKPLHPSKAGKVRYKTTVANTVPLLVAHPSVMLAREIGFGVAALCLLLALWLARPLLRSGSGNEPARIRTLYASHIVEVRDLTLRDGPVADLSSMEALADLAKQYESKIMHLNGERGDAYLVWDNGMLYRYQPAVATPERATTSSEATDNMDQDPRALLTAKKTVATAGTVNGLPHR